jgi:periplasmic protein TonB
MASNPSSDARQLFPSSLRAPAPGERSKSALTVSVSVAAHAVVLGALLLLPLLSDDRLPEQGAVRAFFATPLEVEPPAPPPPPAAGGAARGAAHAAAARPSPEIASRAPVEVPDQAVPEPGIDLGAQGGVAGDIEGGVPGGVVGGIVGGLPEAPPPPLQPLRVGDAVREPRKLRDAKPVYPPLALSSRLQGVVILECVVDTRGRVQEARVLRGVPLLDQAALDAVRQWVYSVTLVDGLPVPVIMTVTVSFRLG